VVQLRGRSQPGASRLGGRWRDGVTPVASCSFGILVQSQQPACRVTCAARGPRAAHWKDVRRTNWRTRRSARRRPHAHEQNNATPCGRGRWFRLATARAKVISFKRPTSASTLTEPSCRGHSLAIRNADVLRLQHSWYPSTRAVQAGRSHCRGSLLNAGRERPASAKATCSRGRTCRQLILLFVLAPALVS
jgi:hypothetical protein